MLFFKGIKADKLNSPKFRKIYEAECHICETTLKLASLLDDMPDMGGLAVKLGTSEPALDNLVHAEYCDPKLVVKLCRHMDMDAGRVIRECPRLNASSTPDSGG